MSAKDRCEDVSGGGCAIGFEDVSYSYKSGARALRDVSLRVDAGEFVAIVGANGSGKSTLAKHVNALLVPQEGTVCVAGFDTRDASHPMDIRSCAGMVFQNPDNQSVASIVREDVAFGPENLGLSPDEVRKRVEDALGQVGMAGHADDEIHSLSGGQKQLVAIAGVLAMHPQILVLDEPGAMLDVRGRAAVMRIVRELHAQGLTIMLVTHFMEDALEADHVIALDGGHIALDGTPAEVFADADRLRELHLMPPFGAVVADGLRKCGVPVGSGLDEGDLRAQILQFTGSRAAADAKSRGVRTGSCATLEKTRTEDSAQRKIARSAHKGLRNSRDFASAAASGPAPVAFDHVSFSYDAAAGDAIHDLSLSLVPGELLGVVGHTGSGKSTLAQLMNALLVPTSGKVTAAGLDTSNRKLRRQIRSEVGLVFQYPEAQLFAATVAEDVAFGPRNLKLAKDEIERRCCEALARVGLDYEELAERSPFALSGGQQRRVAIAGVLAMEPQVLVLDEPAAGLDPLGIVEMRTLLRKLNAEGTTIVLVSHSMDEVAKLCDRVLVLDHGSCLAIGAPSEVFALENAPKLQAVGLGVPRATAFAIELAAGGLELEGPILTTDQLVAALSDRLKKKA